MHKLNRDDIKFVTQQYVKRESGRALTDLYFPAINLHIEIDEPFHLKQAEHDNLREADIIDATGHEVIRISVDGSLRQMNERIDDCVAAIKSKIGALGDCFEPWDMDKELSIEPHIRRGYIDVKDNVAFRRITVPVTVSDITTSFSRRPEPNTPTMTIYLSGCPNFLIMSTGAIRSLMMRTSLLKYLSPKTPKRLTLINGWQKREINVWFLQKPKII